MKKCFEINSGRFFLSSNFLFRIAKNSTALTFVEDFFFSVSWMKFLKRRKKHSEELNVFSITKAVRIFRLKKKKIFPKKIVKRNMSHCDSCIFTIIFFANILFVSIFPGSIQFTALNFQNLNGIREGSECLNFFFFSRFFSFLLFYLEALRHLEWSQSHWQWASSASTASAASSICSTACCSACSCWHSCIWSVSASEAATL